MVQHGIKEVETIRLSTCHPSKNAEAQHKHVSGKPCRVACTDYSHRTIDSVGYYPYRRPTKYIVQMS